MRPRAPPRPSDSQRGSYAMHATHRVSVLPGRRSVAGTGVLEAAVAPASRALRRVGRAFRRFASRTAASVRTLTPQQVCATVFVAALLLYLLVLVVQPTGAGRGGR